MHSANHALIIIDLQNDFCPGGSLAVDGGDEIVTQINDLMQKFSAIVLTQDWHPLSHSSFAANQEGYDPFDVIETHYGAQVLWPTHCVQGSAGADFHKDLQTDAADLIVRKGFRTNIDSYSAFFENDRETATGLDGYLKSRGIDTLTMFGLATDYCVHFSAVDAARLGYKVSVIEHLCRSIDLDGSLAAAQKNMLDSGVTLV